jgi:uncharacterized repeat protein (TIGR03803 family)
MHSTIAEGERRSRNVTAGLRPASTNAAIAARGALTLAALSALLLAGTQGARAQTETVLYSFKGGPDGANPEGGTPVFDKQGNLYGTTVYGGAYNLGTVWKLTPSGTETVLWSFGNGSDGAMAVGLSIDKKGNLYGATLEGGAYNGGTVFEVTPSGTETVLWSFGNGTDGSEPGAQPILDKNGTLFGTTQAGGAYGGGIVYELTPSGTETVLWSFGNGNDGSAPDGPVLDVNGILYGTTRLGGIPNPLGTAGTVWELTPSGTETVLYSFNPDHTKDGAQPDGNVVMDRKGNLYGNCHTGSRGSSGGTVFKLTPSGTEKVIYRFDDSHQQDGINPYATVVLDKKDNLYSTTNTGGAYNGGTVWKMTPSGKETVLWSLGNGTDGSWTTSGAALDAEGNIYGMTIFGGTGSCTDGTQTGCGTVFKVTP